ncbi:unnamed protein product [Amoebophrya sp. A25]|nr:unnamed protein product [Amoebophrya sp. A25]|eukprot:GSA25T00020069001.1
MKGSNGSGVDTSCNGEEPHSWLSAEEKAGKKETLIVHREPQLISSGGVDLSPEQLKRNQELRMRWCIRLREALERAGPVFIKWGQWASTRYDLFPVELCDELNKLTQNSPAHTLEETKEIMIRNFGPSALDYVDLEPEPVASGSIGQVYRARVRLGEFRHDQYKKGLANAGCAGSTEDTRESSASLTSKGINAVDSNSSHQTQSTTTSTSSFSSPTPTKNMGGVVKNADPDYVVNVAIKVQHPKLEGIMAIDFAILELLSRFTDAVCNAYMENSLRLNRMLRQFQVHMGDQLDFNLEAENLRAFRRNFESWGSVVFPKASVSTPEVLVESFEPGASIAQFIKLKQQDRDREKRKRELLDKGVSENFCPTTGEAQDGRGIFRSGTPVPQLLSGSTSSSSSSSSTSASSNSSSFSQPSAPTTGALGGASSSSINAANPEYEAGEMHGELVEKLGTLGLMALLKMIIVDNFIHADMHPGNVFVRHHEPRGGYLTTLRHRVQNWIMGLGTDLAMVPQLCLLDAGLSARIDPSLGENVRGFFSAMLKYDGRALAKEILALSEANHGNLDFANREAFVEELSAKGHVWRRIRKDPRLYRMSRSRDVIKDVLDCCRRHRLELDPTILVAVVSTITLEGWQYELDPSVNIMHHVDLTLRQNAEWGNRMARIDSALRSIMNYGTKMASFAL